MQTSLFSNNIRVRHVSDGTTDTFSCTIELIDESYLQVYFGETLQPTGWTYDESFQQVVFDEIPAEGTIITFLRYFPTIYTKSITEKGIINPEVLDNQMVEMVARIQTVEEKLSRTPTYPIDTEKSGEEVYDDFKRIESVATSAATKVLDTLEEIEDVRNEAVLGMGAAADAAKTTVSKYVDQTLIPMIKGEGQESIDIARTWATGEQAEVEAIEAGQLSSRGYMTITKSYMETTQGCMDTTQGYMTTTEGYMTATQRYMTTTEGYMDTTEAAVAKLEEVDTVVANAKVEITDLSASEQTNIQNTAAASRDAAVTTINNTRDAAVVTVNETRDAAVNTVNSTKNSSVTAVNETRDAAVNTVNSTKNSSVTAVNETKEAAIASIEEKADSYADKTYVTNYQPELISLSQTSGNISLAINKIYSISISGTTTFILPTPSQGKFNQIKLMMKVTGTPTINWGTTYFFNKATPEIEAGSYDVYYDYNNLDNVWVCGVISKGVSE